jgi:hypothetical protein
VAPEWVSLPGKREIREMKDSMMELALVFSPGKAWIDARGLVLIEHRRRQA